MMTVTVHDQPAAHEVENMLLENGYGVLLEAWASGLSLDVIWIKGGNKIKVVHDLE